MSLFYAILRKNSTYIYIYDNNTNLKLEKSGLLYFQIIIIIIIDILSTLISFVFSFGSGSAPIRLRLLRQRGVEVATTRHGGDGRVGPRERGPVGYDREPRTPTTRVRQVALEATGSPSHFHGLPRPPRTPPSLPSLQADCECNE